MIEQVLAAYGLTGPAVTADAFGTGLINHTWKVIAPQGEYILQRINNEVFKTPASIAENITRLAEYLDTYSPAYKFVAPIRTREGKDLIYLEGKGYFRIFPFIAGSHSKDVVETPAQAWEAAVQFGKFTHVLSGFDAKQLNIAIPHFHDLELRYRQFLQALEKGDQQRLYGAMTLVNELKGHAGIVTEYRNILADPGFRIRVTHHDTKISNVLFDKNEKGLCVIDLDTVMPGYFISDVGDMMRTYLSPATEEEKDFEKIVVREDFYKAITTGYYSEMKEELTEREKGCFFYAGKFMIYMQALRFLTDHLNNDTYYGAKYPGHNLTRAGNQAVLLQRLLEKEKELAKM